MNSIKHIAVWGVVAAIGLIGPAVAADFGGVFHWTHYVAALAVLLIAVSATILSGTQDYVVSPLYLVPLMPIVIWIGYSWSQCIPLSPSAIALLSPGAHSAYVTWLEPVLPSEFSPDRFPVSIAPDLSLHASAVFTLVPALICSILVVGRDRRHAEWLMILLAVGAGAHAVYGIIGHLVPELGIQDADVHKVGFGAFINQNNIALLFNLGIACSLTLVITRLRAVLGFGFDRSNLDWSSLILLSTDRTSWIGFTTLIACFSGLLVCGSRSGLVAVLIGGAATYLWFGRRKGLLRIPFAVAAVCFVAMLSVVLFAPFAESLESVRGFREIDLRNDSYVLQTPRLQHWPDGFRAGLSYLPAGSGLGTYAYSHLPFQEAFFTVWFLHADNLWLELFVEQGVFGIVLVLVLVGVVIRSFFRLSESSDPFDYGLQVAGIYLLGCIAWSEIFDFGLIVSGNLFSVAVLFGLVITRSQVVPTHRSRESALRFMQPPMLFAGVRSRLISISICCAFSAPVALCLPLLRADALAEHTCRSIEKELATRPINGRLLEEKLAIVNESLQSHPSSDLFDLSSGLYRRLGRYKMVAVRDPQTIEELNQAIQETRAARISMRWRTDPTGIGIVPGEYSSAVKAAWQSLCRLPLGTVSREHIATLEFAHKSRPASSRALHQLVWLRKGSSDQLVELARLATDIGDETSAAQIWRRATAINPAKTKQALQHALADPTREIADYVDDRPICQRYVSGYLLDNFPRPIEHRDQFNKFLSRSLPLLNCEECDRRDDRARCEEVTGGLCSSKDTLLGRLSTSGKRLTFHQQT